MSDHLPTATTRPLRRTSTWLFIAVAIAISGGSVLAATRYRRPPPPEATLPPGITVSADGVTLAKDAPQWKALKLAAATAAAPRWTDPVPARIVIDETRTSRIGTPLPGRVLQVLVEPGQHVKAGQPLFSVASPNLAELRAERDKAAVDRDTARTSLDRVSALVAASSLPAKEQVEAEQNLKQAEVEVRLADAKLATLKIAGSGDASFTITTPREGVVVTRNVAIGQEISPDAGDPLIVVADLSTVWVVADLFEQDLGAIESGAKAQVTTAALPGKTLEGAVDQVAAVVDPTRHTVPVRVRMDNHDGTLRPNTYAEVKFFKSTPGGVDVPATAVMSDGSRSYVYAQADNGHFVRRVVVAGSVDNGVVPVYAGVNAGDSVVIDGAILLDNQIELAD